MKHKVYSYIRFSTPEQAKGASYARQKEKLEEWFNKRKDEYSLEMAGEEFYDLGVSAWDGSNVHDGKLGLFLLKIQTGEIQKGSYLVVENLDRVSRDDILPALKIFSDIIKAGVSLVTLNDNQEYTEEKLKANDHLIYTIIGTFQRGKHESETKSGRVRDAMTRKRNNLSNIKWDSNYPCWLVLNPAKTEFAIIEEKANVIRRIFSDYDKGISTNTIALNLQNEGIPRPYHKKTKISKNIWHVATVMDYLTSRSVIGEFQPRERQKGNKRIKLDVGPVVENHYPPIIEREQFLRVWAKIHTKKKVRGRRTEGFVNIFRGMLRCPYCGANMMLNRQTLYRGGKAYAKSEAFLCENAHHYNRKCLRYGWTRQDFEAMFFEMAVEVHAEYTKLNAIDTKANNNDSERIRLEIAEIERLEDRLLPLYEAGGLTVAKYMARTNELTTKKKAFANELLKMSLQAPRQMQFDLEKLLDVDLDDHTKREQLADVVGRLFDHIDVYFVGLPSRYRMLQTAQKRYREQGKMKPNQIFARLNRLLPFQKEQFFVGHMKDGKQMTWPGTIIGEMATDGCFGRHAEEECRALGLM